MNILCNACILLALLSALASGAETGSVSAFQPLSAGSVTAVEAPMTAPMVKPSLSTVDATVGQADTAQAQLRMLIGADRPGRPAEGVLLVPSGQTEPKSFDPLVEDLTIMSRIIQKSLGDGYLLPEVSAMDSLIINLALPSANVGPRLFFPLSKRPKPMYVGGYGAVFFLQVDFPLVAPVKPSEETGAQESDPVWSEARRALYENTALGLAAPPEPVEPYNEDRVAMLRSQLIDILRHATNIRTLDPNDWVAIVVRGTAAGDGRTILTLRARKPDIDRYATGQLDPTQFEQRLQIANYKQ